MTLPNVINPVGDLSDGHTVVASEWNGAFDTLYNDLNNSVIPAINALQAAGSTVDIAAQSLFGARLSVATGLPFPPSDTTSSTVYLTPMAHNMIGTYDPATGKWTARKLASDISLAVPAGVRDLYDIFTFWNSGGGSLALEASAAYKSQVATNNPAASGSPVVINMASTAAFAIGDTVSITDGSSQEEASITALVANTSITVDWLKNSFTTPTVRSNSPTDALTSQDGVLLKQSDPTRRYVGTILAIGGQVTDAIAQRGIGNAYNRAPRPFQAVNTSASYSQPVATNMANQDKTLGKERVLWISPAGGGNTPFHYDRLEHNSGQNGAMFQQLDGQNVGYSAAITSTQFGMPLSGNGKTSTIGRHVLDDYFKNTGGGASTITNIFSTLQCSYTNGWVLN